MDHPHVLLDRSPPGYLRVLLARPDRRNALDAGMMRALAAALAADPAVPVLLGSADPRVFSAGADLRVPDPERAAVSDLVYECCELIITRPGPVIAVIAGPAVGGGAQLAAAADLRAASPSARFRWAGPPQPALAVGTWILPRLAGRGAAMELALTGRWVDAAEALALGLVTWVDDDPAARAVAVIQALLAAGPAPAAAVKRAAADGGLLQALHAEQAANRAAFERSAAERR